jgi:uncharacterized protein (AIM24 family)
MSDYVCPYCRLGSDATAPACPNCGAPVDVREIRDKSGWVEQPPIKDQARIQFGRSQCQISGNYVPVAEMSLAQGDSVYFSHHVLLWTEPGTQLAARQMAKGWDRRRAGMPLVMLEASGPGRIAFSDDDPGEVIAVPLEAGRSLDVVEHHFLVATSAVTYDWIRSGIWFTLGTGNDKEWFHPLGTFMDRFTANEHGLLLLHARGNAFIRDLDDGERIYIAARALIYKDRSVSMNVHLERPSSVNHHWRLIQMVRLVGPGRIAIQSKYGFEPEEHWAWNDIGPHGTWSNWNSQPSKWRPRVEDREP